MSNLIKFEYYVPSNNRSGNFNLPISTDTNNPTLLARLYFPTENISDVWLTATVGWKGDAGIANVLFKIWRDTSVIASALSGAETGAERYYEFNLSHVDSIPTSNLDEKVYYLTAELVNPSPRAIVIGPITFTAAQITQN